MPTFYAPGERKYRKAGKVYTNRFYVVRGYVNGIEYEKTTTCLRKKGNGGAEQWWSKFEAAIWAGSAPVPTRETATFKDAVTMYRKASPDLSINDGRYLDRLEAHFGDKLLADFTAQTLRQAAVDLYPNALPQTRNRQAIAPAAAVMHQAYHAKLCEWLHVERLDEVDPYRPMVRPAKAELAIQTAEAQGKHELAVLLSTVVYQGWRISETLSILVERIDFKRAEVDRWVAKSRKWKHAVVDRELSKAWATLPANEDGRLFTFVDRWDVYRAIDSLGLPFHYRPHMSRRGFATELNDADVSEFNIATAGGWEDPRSVRVYIQANLKRDRQTLGKLRGNIRGKAKKGAA